MGIKWIKLDSIASTNSYITELMKVGKAKEELVVTADYQDTGKGQGDHLWQSNKGENLLMSILLHPAFLSASDQFQLSRLTSLAICDILASLDLEPVIKWPNDILTEWGKIAGILIEHAISGRAISHTIIGIGLNLNQSVFPEFPISATSVALEKGNTLSPYKIAEQLLKRILSRYDQLKNGIGNVLELEYLKRLHLIDQRSSFLIGGNECQGVIRGVTHIGELQVEIDGNVKTFGHQEIRLKVSNRRN